MNNFFEPPPDLAPDLEWMLQSGQVSQDALAAGLVREYYAPVYKMALCLLENQQAAREAAQKTFIAALSNLHRYRPEPGARQWLFGLGLRICLKDFFSRRNRQKFSGDGDSMGITPDLPAESRQAILNSIVGVFDEKTRLATCLYYLEGWAAEEIGALLGVSEEAVGTCLDSARQSCRDALDKDGGVNISPDFLEQRLVEVLQARWAQPALSDSEVAGLAAEIRRWAGRRNDQRRALTMTLEAALVILAGLIIGGLAWGANLLEPEPILQKTRLVETVLVTQLITVPVTSTPIVILPVIPGAAVRALEVDFGQRSSISPRAEVDEIYSGLRRNYWGWRTLWLDASFISYGPIGYIGPPKTARVQLWLSDEYLLLLRGELATSPQDALLVLVKEGEVYQTAPGQGTPWVRIVDADGIEALRAVVKQLIPVFDQLPDGSSRQPGMSYPVVGSDQSAGRKVKLVEQRDQDGNLIARRWIDEQTGLVLRIQQYAQDANRVRVIEEMAVPAVSYDMDFPPALSDPERVWAGGFILDYPAQTHPQGTQPLFLSDSGRPRLVQRLPPEGLNPAQKRLVFQYPAYFDPGYASTIISLFTDYYWLGEVYFGNPWTMICDRSPDGRLIAYVSQPFASPPGDSALRWFSLDQPEYTQRSWLEGKAVTNMAFAPDSRRLGVFGFTQEGGGVFVVDTENGVFRKLLDLADARSLTWSTDGEQLALIGRTAESPGEDRVMVIQVDSGNLIYDQSIDYESGAAEDWPMVEWGIEFPVDMGGLEACAAP